jgi:hypothetical protein
MRVPSSIRKDDNMPNKMATPIDDILIDPSERNQSLIESSESIRISLECSLRLLEETAERIRNLMAELRGRGDGPRTL